MMWVHDSQALQSNLRGFLLCIGTVRRCSLGKGGLCQRHAVRHASTVRPSHIVGPMTHGSIGAPRAHLLVRPRRWIDFEDPASGSASRAPPPRQGIAISARPEHLYFEAHRRPTNAPARQPYKPATAATAGIRRPLTARTSPGAVVSGARRRNGDTPTRAPTDAPTLTLGNRHLTQVPNS